MEVYLMKIKQHRKYQNAINILELNYVNDKVIDEG